MLTEREFRWVSRALMMAYLLVGLAFVITGLLLHRLRPLSIGTLEIIISAGWWVVIHRRFNMNPKLFINT